MKWLFNPLVLAATLSFAAGCQKVEKIEVKPAQVTFSTAGQKTSLQARALTADGKPVEDSKFEYASSDGKVAQVDPSGAVTAGKSGSATVTVKSGEKSATVPVTVSIPAAITVKGAPFTLTGLESVATVESQVQDDAGKAVQNAEVAFTSADSAIVEVKGNQLVAKGLGTTSVTATSGELKQAFDVTVALPEISTVTLEAAPATLKVGETATLAAVAKGSDGAAIQGVRFSYTSSDEKIATVDASGTVKAVKAGSATITAEGAGKTTEAKLTIKKK
ncbi:Ig-like domain-containing protein [Stigmatella aurantiaca]|uniref:Conserved uncharacterized protein n=1 Tax=Stigmatella aurantiaca (strain DW4/3-1) TaxID=378806 RepID=E3FL37_STIAD|nr:Ig-like domain-containing protein [Stigmatella aurantiaca]ADO71745.1 conserved uncharacterized protein [Stigmatella aurantiaca DW4/3-1]